MNAEIHQIYESIIEKTAQAKKLKEELEALKAKVVEYHHGEKLVCEDGFESTVKHTVRDTPQPKAIAEKFGLKSFDYSSFPECFKRTEYDSVSVKKLILG